MAVALAPTPAPAEPLVYYPQPKQESWHQCPAYESGFGGAKFGGKSLAMVMEATRYHDHPGYRGIIFRRTNPRLQELLDRTWQWFPALGATWSGDERAWRFPSRAKVYLRHCQHEEDKYNYQGHQYQFMGFDQLEEFTETQYLYLLAQNRSGVAELASYTRSTFNPGGIGHAWVKDRFIDHGSRVCAPWTPTNEQGDQLASRCFHFASIDDNPAGEAADPTYRQRLDALPEEERRALKGGDWDVFAGQMFTEWRREKHVVEPVPLPSAWPTWDAVDYGTARPFVCLTLVQDPGTLRLYVTHEISQCNVVPASKQAQLIVDSRVQRKHRPRFTVGDPAMWIRQADTGKSIAQIYAEIGVPMIQASNERISGLARVREFMADDEDGRPLLQVFSTCTQLIKNVPSLVRDAHRVEDVDTDGPDDEYDALRYGAMAAHWVQRTGRTSRKLVVRPRSITSDPVSTLKRAGY